MFRRRFHTTRMQMFFGYISVMLLILVITIGVAYHYVSLLLLSNSDKYVHEISNQVNGRMDALLQQIDTITLQIMMANDVQQILTDAKQDRPISFADKLNIRPTLNQATRFSDVIKSIDLYSLQESIYPADRLLLANRVKPEWIAEADRRSGHLIWIGADPQQPDTILGLRQVRLESDNYTKGGYLVISVHSFLFDFLDSSVANIEGSATFLLNQHNDIVSAGQSQDVSLPAHALGNIGNEIAIGGTAYKVIQKPATPEGWKIVILLPMNKITQGISVLQKVLLISSVLGMLLFAVSSFMLSTVITKPLRNLMKKMKTSKEGRFETNPAKYRNREINALNSTYNKMVENMNHLIETVYKQEIIKMKLEVKALQAQMNPHFLFNTLEAFYWSLIEKEERELASRVIGLADIFRYTMKKEEEDDFVRVAVEIAHVQRYAYGGSGGFFLM